MPLIKPEVQRILRKAGLKDQESENRSVDENLNLAGLSNEAIAEELTRLALNSQSESLKLRALETALKVRGALKETSQAPQFTIIIQNADNSTSQVPEVNPILFPRQSLKNGSYLTIPVTESVTEEEDEEDEEDRDTIQ